MSIFKKILFLTLFSFGNPAFSEDDESFSASSAIQVQTSELQEEVYRLNGKLEEVNHRVQQLEKNVQALSTEISDFLQHKKPEEAAVAPSPEMGAAAVEQTLPPAIAQEEYGRAIELLREEKYEEARHSFLNFIKNNPKNDLKTQAHYWLAMTYYLEKNYKKAAENFAENYQKDPESSKAFDNLFRLAQSLDALGKTKDACATLDQLLTTYPKKNSKSPLIEEAKKEQERLKCPKR